MTERGWINQGGKLSWHSHWDFSQGWSPHMRQWKHNEHNQVYCHYLLRNDCHKHHRYPSGSLARDTNPLPWAYTHPSCYYIVTSDLQRDVITCLRDGSGRHAREFESTEARTLYLARMCSGPDPIQADRHSEGSKKTLFSFRLQILPVLF